MNCIKKTYLLLTALCALALASCSDDTPSRHETSGLRTVLVYMVADNSLGSGGFDQADLDEMSAAAVAGDLDPKVGRWLVYHSRKGTDSGNAPELAELQADGTFKTLKTYPDKWTYSVDSLRMREVIDDARAAAPAGSYGLVLWSHGSGWEEGTSSRSLTPEVASYGDDRGKSMKITSLAATLAPYHFDYIYFDCCFMATVEVAYELRRVADVLVGSVCELPVDGMPYDLNLRPLLAGKAAQGARNTFEHYDAMAGMDRTCAMSVVRTDGLDALAAATRRVMEAKFTDFGQVSVGSVQKFMRSDRRNTLWDLRQYVELLCGGDGELLKPWNAAFDAVVTYAAATPTIFGEVEVLQHCGLGTYMVTSKEAPKFRGYENQSWFRDVVSAAPVFQN